MAIHLPARRYFTFDELQQRWACEANDIRDIICCGALVPSWHVIGSLPWAKWTSVRSAANLYPPLVPEVRHASDGSELHCEERGWLFMRCPVEVGSLDCRFDMLCTSATDSPEMDDRFPPVANWYCLAVKLSLSDAEERGVFMLTEVARFESAADTSNTEQRETGKRIGTRERNTFLTIIAALCSEAKVPLDKPSKAAQTIVNAAQLCGLDLAERTVAEKLKLIPAVHEARGI